MFFYKGCKGQKIDGAWRFSGNGKEFYTGTLKMAMVIIDEGFLRGGL